MFTSLVLLSSVVVTRRVGIFLYSSEIKKNTSLHRSVILLSIRQNKQFIGYKGETIAKAMVSPLYMERSSLKNKFPILGTIR